MILVTERNALAAAMTRIAAIVDSRQTIPILGNVLLSAAGDRLSLRVTNLDMEAIEYIPAVVGTEGAITVSANKFSALAASLPQGAQVGLKFDTGRLGVSSGRSKFNLATLPANSFPALWQDDWPASITIPAEVAAEMLGRVAFAVSTEATRAYLQGVNVSRFDGLLRLIALNGFMLSRCDGFELDTQLGSYTIPAKMVTEMTRMLSGMTGDVVIALSTTKVMLRNDDSTITSKLIDASLGYPETDRLIPKDLDKRALVNVAVLSAAIRRTMIASQNAKDNTVRLTFRPGAVAVTARNAEADALDEVDSDYDGDEMMLALNPPYLLSMLEHLDGPLAEFTFKNNKTAVVVRDVEPGGRLSLVMPQNVAP